MLSHLWLLLTSRTEVNACATETGGFDFDYELSLIIDTLWRIPVLLSPFLSPRQGG